MNIAQIGPFYEAVSLHSEGPEGRMIASLSEGLLRLRHDVTVFASGDSHTAGTVIPVAPLAMRAYPVPKRHLADALAMLALEKAFAMAPTFDMIHVHAGSVAFPLMRRSPIPIVGTIYGPIDAPEVLRLHREFRELALVATSAAALPNCLRSCRRSRILFPSRRSPNVLPRLAVISSPIARDRRLIPSISLTAPEMSPESARLMAPVVPLMISPTAAK